MNKKVITILIVLIVVGFGVFMIVGRAPQTLVDNPTQDKTTKVADKTKQVTLKSLLAIGKSQKCTFSDSDVASISGTVYVADGKMRADLAPSDDQSVARHVIVDVKYMYKWEEGSKEGTKIDINLNEQQEKILKGRSRSFGMNQMYNYVCQDWVKDESVLTPPAKIKFRISAIPPTDASADITSSPEL